MRGLPWVLIRTDNKLGDVMNDNEMAKSIIESYKLVALEELLNRHKADPERRSLVEHVDMLRAELEGGDDIMKARVQVKTISARLLGIKIPDTSIGGSPFYILLTENKIRKGWQVALVDAMAYYATESRALMAQEGEYYAALNKAIVYLESLILMTGGESHANA